MTSHNEEFSHLPFSQREGLIAIPPPLKIGELSEELRRDLSNYFWEVLNEIISENSNPDYSSYEALNAGLIRIFAKFDSFSMKEISESLIKDRKYLVNRFEEIFLKKVNHEFVTPYNRVLDFLELLLIDDNIFEEEMITSKFKQHQAAYVLVLFKSNNNWNFHPITNEANRIALQRDLKNIEDSEYHTAIQYLARASKAFSADEFEIVISESNNAVEAIARDMTGKSTLGKAIKQMKQNNSQISKNLLNAFDQFSAFANANVRHGQERKKDDPKIGQNEALLMFSTCAAIASYLNAQAIQYKKEEK